MTHIVSLSNGEEVEFPDEMTDEQIQGALKSRYSSPQSNQREMFKNSIGINKPGISDNLSAGLLQSLKSISQLAPDISMMAPESMQKYLPYQVGERPADKFDPYSFTGTTNDPFYTPSGLTQLAGEFFMPGGSGAKAGIASKIDGTKNLASKLIDYFSPSKPAKELLNKIGSGAKNSEEVSESLANDIRNAHDMRAQEAGIYLDYALKRAGNEKIYEHIDPLITTSMDKEKSIINRLDDLNIGDFFDKFKKNPTFQNAHNLQSELGVMIGDMEKKPYKTASETNSLNNIKSIRDTLKSDIDSFLEKRGYNSNENLREAYKRGIDLYRENVAPYLSSKKLREITRGGKTLVDNLHDIFKSPSNTINRSNGNVEIGAINKILQDLPEKSKGKILFSKIGASKNANNPSALAQSIIDAENEGYSKYVNSDLKTSIADILSKQKHQDYLKKAAPYAGVSALGTAIFEELFRRNSRKGENQT